MVKPITFDSPPIPMGRTIRLVPGYDLSEEPGGYGVSGMKVMFYLRGPRGGISWGIYTDWIPWLPQPRGGRWGQRVYRFDTKAGRGSQTRDLFPSGLTIAYHSPVPPPRESEDDYVPAGIEGCGLLGGEGLCYSDGSGLAGEELLVRLIYDGESAVWAEMERWYEERLPAEPT